MTDTNGTTQPAGEGIDDDALAKKVAGETSSDLEAKDVFERESGGTDTDKAAAEESADDVE
ncbi:MAG TPA: hypothetical protein VIJ71_09755 [Mycobacteriales bacterium]